MDEKDFKKHLAALVHGHHHPEEHDWSPDGAAPKTAGHPSANRRKARSTARKPKRRAR
ncbi:MAG TPA: hypothetical protein VME43_15535 [Bryobacteraceae bacterium]|nr:hypothetical protein [Bryobacteraceae bacterium]